jgi:hypothetical protein
VNFSHISKLKVLRCDISALAWSSSAPKHGLEQLGSLFSLGAEAPLLEGFDLGLRLPMPGGAAGAFSGTGELLGAQMHSLGVRSGTSPPLLWPSGLLDKDTSMDDAWSKVPNVSAAMWPEEFSAAAAPATAHVRDQASKAYHRKHSRSSGSMFVHVCFTEIYCSKFAVLVSFCHFNC